MSYCVLFDGNMAEEKKGDDEKGDDESLLQLESSNNVSSAPVLSAPVLTDSSIAIPFQELVLLPPPLISSEATSDNTKTSSNSSSEHSGDNSVVSDLNSSVVSDSSSSVLINSSSQEISSLKNFRAPPTKIKRLILEGFKSFNKRTELFFENGFNVVLGANGSGKSNILDSLCFVLGKSSAKSLRAEKSANLIYNGGKSKNPAKQAEVSIIFDNSDKAFPLNTSEVKISRFVKHDGSSVYKINGSAHTRQEIVELLSKAKVDSDGHNIILQGDIVHLVEMSLVERRQVIEEVAGIGVYEEKKLQALNELSKVEEKLNQAEIILKEREKYLRELRKDRDHALKYKNLNDQIKQNRASYVKIQLDRKASELFKLDERSAKYSSAIEKLRQEILNIRSSVASKKEELQKISKTIEEKGEVEQVSLQRELEALKVSFATDNMLINSLRSEINKGESRRAQLEKNVEEIDKKLKELEFSRDDIAEALKLKSEEFHNLESTIVRFKDKHKLGQETVDIEQSIERVDRELESVDREVQFLRENQQNFLREKDRIEFQLQTVGEKIAKAEELESAHKSELSILKQYRQDFKKSVLELNKVLNDDAHFASELAVQKQSLLHFEEELARLRVKNASMQESLQGNVAVKKVLENKSQLGEVYGTIAELGVVDSKYSLALEIASGSKIHSIVVGDDKTASACIRFLKEGKFGFATFLPLNKLKPSSIKSEAKDLLNSKGVHGLAIDLVSFEPEYKSAFQHVFGSTLVVESIDTARRLGIGSARMISIDGDIAESSGEMVGGFRNKKTGVFKDVQLGSQIIKLENSVDKTSALIEELQKSRLKNEEQLSSLRSSKAELEGNIIKLEKSLQISPGSEIDSDEQTREDFEKRLKILGEELRGLESSISKKNELVAKLKIERASLKIKVQELRNPAIIAELASFEQKRRDLFEEKVHLENEVKNFEVQITNVLSAEKNDTLNILKDLKNSRESVFKEVKEKEKAVSELSKTIKEKENIQLKFQSAFKELFERGNHLNDEVGVLESKSFALEEKSRKEEIEFNTLSIDASRARTEHEAFVREFSQFNGVQLVDKPEEQLRKEISDFEHVMADIGSVNLKSLELYDSVEKEFNSLVEKKKVLLTEKEDVIGLMNSIESRKSAIFMGAFNIVGENFRRIFSQLTTKGDARLELETPENIFDGGLDIKVCLTGNKFLDIRSLSGGEKTMTALAFLFAIQECQPAPFYVMDEVDAALDKHNSDKLGKLIRQYCDRAQYIVISHNDGIITGADTLYGVSMDEHGISSVVSLKL